MSYISALNLINVVTRTRETITSDGMGGTTSTSTTITSGKAALWTAGNGKRLISDELMAISSHILVCVPTDDINSDDTITYSSQTYEITGNPDNVMQKGVIQVVPLKLVT